MWVIHGRNLLQGLVLVAVIVAGGYGIWALQPMAVPSAAAEMHVKTFDVVAVEFDDEDPKTGQEREVYRWDPGTIVVQKGDRVRLNIHGLNGDKHPFLIEGLNVQGEVARGEVQTVEFVAKERGVYRLVCLVHTDAHNHGPMIGYIVVQ
ncbi:MAG: cupredoxin domain-containing protein [Bacillota bacterium]